MPRPRRHRLPLVVCAIVAAAAVAVLLRPTAGTAELGPVTTPSAVFTSHDPALTGVDPELAHRFTDAQAAAAAAGVSLTVTSGKRSVEEQQRLVDEAIEKYGSQAEAHRWVLPPSSSAHVQGLALDVGGTAGALWLGEHGLGFGLCRVYANEVWHFEKLPDGQATCAPMHPDSSSGW